MADTKVSGLTAATSLTGADTIYVVQSSTSKKADVNDILNLVPCHIAIACSDETTALTTGTAKVTFRMPYAMTLTDVRASLTGAGSTSGTTTIDINLAGASIFTTDLLTIDFTEKSSTTAATPPNITTTALTDDGEITIDIDAVSGGADETGLKVYLIGTRAAV